jgi:hypothetical protein
MGFDINKLIRKPVVIHVQPKQEERMQEIVLPVYEPSEPLEEVIKRKVVKNENLVRKVPLNPLSD